MSRSVLGRWQKEAACVKRFQIKLIVKKSNILINSVICDVKLFNCYLIEERVIFPAFKEERYYSHKVQVSIFSERLFSFISHLYS